MSVHVIYPPPGSDSDPEDREYERSVTLAMLRRAWGNDISKWPEEERLWAMKESE